jgi:hypothetical protein
MEFGLFCFNNDFSWQLSSSSAQVLPENCQERISETNERGEDVKHQGDNEAAHFV